LYILNKENQRYIYCLSFKETFFVHDLVFSIAQCWQKLCGIDFSTVKDYWDNNKRLSFYVFISNLRKWRL